MIAGFLLGIWSRASGLILVLEFVIDTIDILYINTILVFVLVLVIDTIWLWNLLLLSDCRIIHHTTTCWNISSQIVLWLNRSRAVPAIAKWTMPQLVLGTFRGIVLNDLINSSFSVRIFLFVFMMKLKWLIWRISMIIFEPNVHFD